VSDDLKTVPTEQLVERYVNAAAAHARASEQGDYVVANPQHEIVATIYRELRERREREALLPLLQADDPAVRAWAASHALEFAPAAGEPVLRELSTASGLVGFNAQMTLDTWCSGDLTFP
jgi:hypothetical protein